MEDKLNDLKAKQEIAFRKKANVLEEKARLVEKKSGNEHLGDCIQGSIKVMLDD